MRFKPAFLLASPSIGHFPRWTVELERKKRSDFVKAIRSYIHVEFISNYTVFPVEDSLPCPIPMSYGCVCVDIARKQPHSIRLQWPFSVSASDVVADRAVGQSTKLIQEGEDLRKYQCICSDWTAGRKDGGALPENCSIEADSFGKVAVFGSRRVHLLIIQLSWEYR